MNHAPRSRTAARRAGRIRRGLHPLALWALGALTTGCGAAPPQDGTATADPLAPVKVLIGDAACGQDTQCRTVPIGHKACGGPEGYLAWSTRRTDARALEAAVAAYTAERERVSAREGRYSTCAFVADPGAVCLPSTGTCQLRATGANPTR